MNNYLTNLNQPSRTKAILICFSHAGSGVSLFREFAGKAPEWLQIVGVRLPGRETRFSEDLIDDLDLIADQITVEIRDYLKKDIPCFLMGQCSGAVLAYEVATRLTKNEISGLIACSTPAPNYKTDKLDLEGEGLVKSLIKSGGMEPEILNQPELLELLLPIIKNDFSMLNKYQSKNNKLNGIPILILKGKNDNLISLSMLENWGDYTDEVVDISIIEGNHFLINEIPQNIMNDIKYYIQKITGGTK